MLIAAEGQFMSLKVLSPYLILDKGSLGHVMSVRTGRWICNRGVSSKGRSRLPPPIFTGLEK